MCSIIGVGERLHKVLGQIDLAHWTQVSDRCPLGYLSNIFSAETTGLIEAKFHMEPPLDRGTKVFKQSWSHDQDGCHAHIL